MMPKIFILLTDEELETALQPYLAQLVNASSSAKVRIKDFTLAADEEGIESIEFEIHDPTREGVVWQPVFAQP